MKYLLLSKTIVPPNYYEDSVRLAARTDSTIVVDNERLEKAKEAANRLGVLGSVKIITMDEFIEMKKAEENNNDSTK